MASQCDDDDPRIEQAARTDGDALEELLREFGPEVASGLSIDPRWRPVLDPEDVMQVTYLEAYLRISTLRTRTAAGFRAWLARIAENNLRDAVRALSRDKRPEAHGRATRAGGTAAETLLATLAGADPTAGSIAAGREAVSRLRSAIEGLPPSYHRVVVEVDLGERTVAEVAAELGKSPGAVHMLRSRAHERLKELLGGATVFFGDSA